MIVAFVFVVLAIAFSGKVATVRTPSLITSTTTPVVETAGVAQQNSTTTSAQHATSTNVSSPLDISAAKLRAALVNIICYAPTNSSVRSITGSGVIIDPKGIILTNAHIAQYFLLTKRNVFCTIRAGSPAVDKYKASPVYISPAWLKANADLLTQTNPIGTGEHDFAFLVVTSSATTAKLPVSFPYIPLATGSPIIGTSVAIASYGAQTLGVSQIQSALFPTIAFGSVQDVFTFASTTIDVLALGGSVAAQKGSSGGGIVGKEGKLLGTLTTSMIGGDTNTRVLHAITTSYIRNEYTNETGQTLDTLLAKSPTTAVVDFAPQIPALEAILTAHLP